MSAGDAEIRPYEDRDFDVLVRAWHETNQESFPYVALQQQHTPDDARRFFRDHVVPVARIWVADADGELQGLVALEAPWIRQLAVFPPFQRRGIGSALLRAAQAASPAELRLYTFFRNAAACFLPAARVHGDRLRREPGAGVGTRCPLSTAGLTLPARCRHDPANRTPTRP